MHLIAKVAFANFFAKPMTVVFLLLILSHLGTGHAFQ